MTRPPADHAVRDRVVRDFDTTFLLEAGAGTGKTTVLVSRVLALVRPGRATPARIVAITFTEKAAAIPPCNAQSRGDRLREAVATLEPLKSRCTNTEDDAYQQIERLAAFHERAERADGLALERLSRELFVNAHKGQQGNWSPKEACKDAKAELKALKDAQERYERDSNADLAWALRDRLRGFLDGYEALKRERALVDF